MVKPSHHQSLGPKRGRVHSGITGSFKTAAFVVRYGKTFTPPKFRTKERKRISVLPFLPPLVLPLCPYEYMLQNPSISIASPHVWWYEIRSFLKEAQKAGFSNPRTFSGPFMWLVTPWHITDEVFTRLSSCGTCVTSPFDCKWTIPRIHKWFKTVAAFYIGRA